MHYLLEPQVAMWMDNPEPTEPGEYYRLLFKQPGMVGITAAGELVSTEAQWSPKYFKRQTPLDQRKKLPTNKVHTLPWRREA